MTRPRSAIRRVWIAVQLPGCLVGWWPLDWRRSFVSLERDRKFGFLLGVSDE